MYQILLQLVRFCRLYIKKHFGVFFRFTVYMYTVSQKNDTDVAHYNFNAHQPILVIFGRDVAERVFISNGDLLSHLS